MEATCARTLDLLDKGRIPKLDDLVFLASKRGKAVWVLAIIAEWSHDVKVFFFSILVLKKLWSIFFLAGVSLHPFWINLFFFPFNPPALPAALVRVSSHKSPQLRLTMVIVATCSAMVDTLRILRV